MPQSGFKLSKELTYNVRISINIFKRINNYSILQLELFLVYGQTVHDKQNHLAYMLLPVKNSLLTIHCSEK